MNAIHDCLKLLLTAALVGCTTGSIQGETDYCTHCGSSAGLRRVCRAVHTTERVEVTRWDAAEEEIAVPVLRGLFPCKCAGWGGACSASGTCTKCLTGGCRACCKVRPRNRLMRKTFLEEAPVVLWVIEYVCTDCAAHGGAISCATPAQDPHFFGPAAPSPPPVPDLTAAYATDLADAPAPQRQDISALDELINTLQGSMQRK